MLIILGCQLNQGLSTAKFLGIAFEVPHPHAPPDAHAPEPLPLPLKREGYGQEAGRAVKAHATESPCPARRP